PRAITSRYTVRTETSSSVASWPAVWRPRVCSNRTRRSSRSARTSQSLPPGTDKTCQSPGPSVTDMNTDFDFLAGSWTRRQRRLVKILDNCDEWYEFDVTTECQTYLDGEANFDVLRAPEIGLEGLTLRLFNPTEQVWRIWWAAKRTGGMLEPPVVGRFVGNVG